VTDALKFNPNHAPALYTRALALACQGTIDEPLADCAKAMALQPDIDKSVDLHDILGMNFARANRFREAMAEADRAISLARAAGDTQRLRQIAERRELYRRNQPFRPTATSETLHNAPQ